MRNVLLAACSTVAVCGVAVLAPGLAVADSGPSSTSPSNATSPSDSSSSSPSLVGAAKVTVSPSTAHTGDTVEVSGAAAPYPGAKYESVTTKAGVVHITDENAEHVRGTLRITAGPGTYNIKLVFSNGSASTPLHVVKSPSPKPTPPKPTPPGPKPSGGGSGHVPKGAPRTGAPATAGGFNDGWTYLGAGLTVAAMAALAAALGRKSRKARAEK